MVQKMAQFKSSTPVPSTEREFSRKKSKLPLFFSRVGGAGVNPQSSWIYTYYERDAKGNILAVYKRTFTGSSGHDGFHDHVKLMEHDIYGSTRLGIRDGNSADEWVTTFSGTCGTSAGSMFTGVSYDMGPYIFTSGAPTNFTRVMGYKEYEATNHLGNVLETFSDKRIPTCGTGGSSATVAYYQPDIKSATDYYAFGGQEPNRTFSGGNSQYGFNGKEKDNEVYNGDGNSYDYGARQYNPRLGRWMSIDPLAIKYPELSPYSFAGNSPIAAMDPDGKRIRITTSTGETFTYKPGMVYKGTDAFAQKSVDLFNKAYESNNGNKDLVLSAVNTRKVVTVVERVPEEAMGAVAYYDPTDQTLHIDPNLGAELFNEKGENYGFYSPMRVLTHELRHFIHHALNPKQYKKDTDPTNPENAPEKIGNMTTVEEKKTIHEDNTANPDDLQRTEHVPTPKAVQAGDRETTPNADPPNGPLGDFPGGGGGGQKAPADTPSGSGGSAG